MTPVDMYVDNTKARQLSQIQPLRGWKSAAWWVSAAIASLGCWWGIVNGPMWIWRLTR